MKLDDAWKTEIKLMDSNVNVLIITTGNIVNTKSIVRTINILISVDLEGLEHLRHSDSTL